MRQSKLVCPQCGEDWTPTAIDYAVLESAMRDIVDKQEREIDRLTAAYAEMLVELHAEIDLLMAELAKAKCSCGRQGGHAWDCPANPNRQAAEAKGKP